MSYYPTPRSKPLTLLQINVGRWPTPHEIALSLAFSENIDIILIQEPFISKDLSRRLTKCHPSYECFAPTDDWTANGRPRVLTYIRKGAGFHATQVWPNVTDPTVLSDFLFLQPAGLPFWPDPSRHKRLQRPLWLY